MRLHLQHLFGIQHLGACGGSLLSTNLMNPKLTMKIIARLWMAIGKPPSIGVDKTTMKIHAKLAEVNSEATFQLHKRSQNIHILVEDSNTRIKDLRGSNDELERLNGVLARSLERLEDQHRKFVKEVERMRRLN